MTPAASPPPPAAPTRARRYLRTFAGALLGLTVAGIAIGAWTVDRIWRQLPAVDHLATYRPAMPLRIYSRDGVLLAEYGIERREFVPIGQIPPRVRHALLAAEDARFYEHGPVDFGGLARATLTNLVAGHSAQGGSTISMQVARNFYLTRDKLISRKLAEILMAYKLESAYGKNKLLELYMNQIYLGERAYGFAAAASIYFGKPLDQLSDAEAAVLAGLPKAPSAFNPAVNPARAHARRQYVLRRMHELGYLDGAAYQQAADMPLTLANTPPPGIVAAPYVAERARRMMVERYRDDAYTLGLDVTTTVTMRDQLAAEAALRHAVLDARMRRARPGAPRAADAAAQGDTLEGALVSLDAGTGDILALAGGADFRRNPFDHALQAYRQPGSSFKPFVYSAALEKGYFPGTLVDDTQRTLSKEETGANRWRPRNYANNYEGFIPMRRGLMRSKNLVAVSLMQAAQPLFVQRHALGFGFEDVRNPASLPLALGAGSVTPLQLASAYGAFANGGLRAEPRLIETVRLRNGGELFRAPEPATTRAISARNAFVMDSMLRDVVRFGTARGALPLRRTDTAGKTGTSNGSKDVWFAGYSSGVVAVAWLGYDAPRSLGRATGATLALPVWLAYMKVAVDGRMPVDPAMPNDVALIDGDYVYAEYPGGKCVDAPPPYIRSAFACGGTRSDAAATREGWGADASSAVPAPLPPVDAAERARVLELFRTED
ncbi:penicillin-binding protein 1A [Burkholderia alba]|uniref:penicillin-binding protein 1A n=1 Tax=Burkholderia alba TaxID=2683677 RepID=UPI002B060448|nr:PBP1A family penicillin-binding protein [Burkholderia alba]